MKPPKVKHISVVDLRKRFSERVFAVPKLQREFVWNGARAAALLDSISKGMPIGVVLIWETKPSQYDLLRKSSNVLPPFDTNNPFGWFIIDGQQRLAVLHEAYEGGVKTNSSRRNVDFGRVCFVLRHEADEDVSPDFVYRKPIPREYVAVQDILADNRRHRFNGYPKNLLKRIAACRERIRQYQVPYLLIHSNDLEEVRSVFLRINSQGMTIDSADRAFARAAKVDLRDLAHDLRSRINKNFDDIHYTAILQGFAFVTEEREPDVGERALEGMVQWWENQIDENGKSSMFFDRWKKYRAAFIRAVDYLVANFSVLHSGFLPSINMLATLSVFFFHHPTAPNTKQQSEIRKWFWATGVGVRYSGRGHRKNQVEDVDFFKRLATSSRAPFKFPDLVDPIDLARQEYTKHSGLTSAFYCLLARQEPCYIANGRPIEAQIYAANRRDRPDDKVLIYPNRSNRRDRHHIFPLQLLANNGFTHKDFNSLCNICFIDPLEDKKFGMRRPDRYLAEFTGKRHFQKAMRSHLIPYDAESGLWTASVKKGYTQFRRRRLREICRALERQAGMNLFRKS